MTFDLTEIREKMCDLTSTIKALDSSRFEMQETKNYGWLRTADLTYQESKDHLIEINAAICSCDGVLKIPDVYETGYMESEIPYRECEKIGCLHVGSFHIHPISGTMPSHTDLEEIIYDYEQLGLGQQINCIGALINKKKQVSCIIPKRKFRGLKEEIPLPSLSKRPERDGLLRVRRGERSEYFFLFLDQEKKKADNDIRREALDSHFFVYDFMCD